MAFSAYTAYEGVNSVNKAKDAQAELYRQNAMYAEEDASDIISSAYEGVNEIEAMVESTLDSQIDSIVAGGASLSSDSLAHNMKATVQAGYANSLSLAYDAVAKAKKTMRQADSYNTQADVTKMGKQSALLSAISSGLSGGIAMEKTLDKNPNKGGK